MKTGIKAKSGNQSVERVSPSTFHASRITHHASRPWPLDTRPSTLAFTMIEVAISLAIIGFAMVAIIGILPTGMSVQKENREETIIQQDASVFMDAIRNGQRGLDDLTNYVIAITNYWDYIAGRQTNSHISWYTFGGSGYDATVDNRLRLTNGFRIIGLLSTPKTVSPGFKPNGPSGEPNTFTNNHVVAFFRSMSCPANEKVPQTNATVRELTLSYRLISDVIPYGTNYYDARWTNTTGLPPNSPDYIARLNYMKLVKNMETNLHDLRLTFRWPLLPNGNTGPGRQVFRTTVSGPLLKTNILATVQPQPHQAADLFFFQPRTYAKAP